jgi:pimeloyl-ACP methyl ester carboxylesterase
MNMRINPLWLEHDGARLFAAECGAGAPVLLLHGGMGDHRACMPYLQSLSARFHVLAPDQRGSGKSWYGGSLSFELLTQDLLAWMDELRIARTAIVAASSGTGVAVHLALSQPDRVAGMALLQPVYAGAELGLTPEQAGIFAWMDGLASQALAHGIEAIKPLYAAAPEQFREQAIAMAMEYDPASIVATSHFLASGAQPFRSAADLARMQIPAFLVRGADPMHPGTVSDLYQQSLAQVQPLESQDPSLMARLQEFCTAVLDPGG